MTAYTRGSVVLGAMIATTMLSAGAQAADRYNLKIETGLVISEGCSTDAGQAQTSHIELIVEDSSITDPAVLTPAVARLRVCSPFSEPVRENIPMVVPVGLMKQLAKMAVGKTTGFVVDDKKVSEYFSSANRPNYLYAQKVHDGVLQLTFVDRKSNDVKIGPIRVFLGPSTTLKSAKGYSSSKHLPISRLEVEVQQKGVTLDANLTAVDTATK